MLEAHLHFTLSLRFRFRAASELWKKAVVDLEAYFENPNNVLFIFTYFALSYALRSELAHITDALVFGF